MKIGDLIKGKKIYLKNLELYNATTVYCGWLNDLEVNKYLETKNATIDELKKYITEKNNNRDCLLLGIFSVDSDKHIGNIKLESINLQNKSAEMGIMVGDKNYWGKGIATEAVKILTDYAFRLLNLDKILLGVISKNKAAIKVYQKSGFRVEKINKDAKNHNGILYDQIIMSIEKK